MVWKPFRYQISMYATSGQDIRIHEDQVDKIATIVRNWLGTASGRKSIPGAAFVRKEFAAFSKNLPQLCDDAGWDRDSLEFCDYRRAAEAWVEASKSKVGKSLAA